MRSGLTNIQRCPGCGDTLIIMALKNAFKELSIESHKRVVVSGVGCSGKASQYVDGYGAETLHGRALPFATGIKLAKPEMTVVIMGGDGDGYGIGMGHFIHSCKRDLNMTYLVFNNENYALTTGQSSPTTPVGAKTKTTPAGNTIEPFDPITLAIDAGCKFAKRADSAKFAELKEIIKKAILHPGFSIIDITQACPSFKRW
ncbi:MAG: thiamine pyrophosphate-dependent enzyme [Candidatus Gracilibacteria bacterium]|nr:thiamine pyrophosphate-dependent enzyme [Candidatus Gracilibacteria bacterium]